MIGSWQAFVSELVPREALLNAVTLNSAQFNAARAFGPAIGGVVLALVGPGWAFFVNGISFVAVIAALLMMRLDRVVEKASGRMQILADFRETIRYVRASPGISACVSSDEEQSTNLLCDTLERTGVRNRPGADACLIDRA